jgi:glucose/arabinose dehydrogenase
MGLALGQLRFVRRRRYRIGQTETAHRKAKHYRHYIKHSVAPNGVIRKQKTTKKQKMIKMKPMKTKFKSNIRAGCHSFGGVVCVGAVLLIASSAQAQNLFETDLHSGNIYEYTPGGARSTFASGLDEPIGLAFNSAGDLLVADYNGNIYEFTPGGVRSTFASGLHSPAGLAFNSAGDLFEADLNSGNIYEYTPGGARSTFASGLDEPYGLAFNSAGDLFAAAWGSGNITEITPGGVQSTFASGLDYPTGLAFQGETLPVPEPSALGLLAGGATALLVCSRRHKA